MPRRLLGVLILLLVSVTIGRAQGDAVLFTVGTDTVRQYEFEYHWKRSTEKQLDVFLQTYGRFKQKIQYAKELGLDTLTEYRLHREQIRQLVNQMRNRPRKGMSKQQEWMKLKHVSCLLNQHASKKHISISEAYMDSIYAVIQRGGRVESKELPWTQTRHLLNEWQKQLQGLDKNEYSKPFYSPMGIHIIAWTDRRIGTLEEESPVEVSRELRMKEAEEGLLISALDTYVEQRLNCTDQELDAYFKGHRDDYGWGIPHFRGAVIHCQDKKEAKRIKKYLQKYPEEHWREAWKRMPNDVAKNARLETGFFPIGKNAYVDKLVFNCGAFEPLADCPYTWVLGKRLKKGPTSYKDIPEKVYRDCKKDKKEAQLGAIQRKYELEIDDEVLKTVNREGIK